MTGCCTVGSKTSQTAAGLRSRHQRIKTICRKVAKSLVSAACKELRCAGAAGQVPADLQQAILWPHIRDGGAQQADPAALALLGGRGLGVCQ